VSGLSLNCANSFSKRTAAAAAAEEEAEDDDALALLKDAATGLELNAAVVYISDRYWAVRSLKSV